MRIRKGDIKALWAGQTVSMFGDEITAVALPTVALLVLNVSPLQFGLIGASSYLPYPVLGLIAGAWIDRVRRKAVLLIADLVRGAAIASIPLAVLTHTVTLAQLVVVGLIVGTASVFFNSAYQAYLPHIVTSDDLSKANARLSISETASQVAGPTMAGGLISLAGVGGAMFTDAVSFLVSVISLLFIRRPEPKPERRRGSLFPEVAQGLRLVIRNRLLLGLTLTSAVSNLGRGMALELVVFFAFKGLHLSPTVVGVMMAAGNAGPFLGSLVSQRFTTRFGLGPALLIGSVMKGLPWVFMPLALLGNGVPVVIAAMVVSGFFIPISNTTTLTIRQTLVSSDMQGRVAATVRTITRTVVPLATILGGALAQMGTRLLGPRAGLTAVLALGGLIWLSAGLLLPRRMLRQVHSIGDLESTMPATTTEDSRRSEDRRGTGPGRRGGARRALQQSLLLGQEPPPWSEELYRPMRMTGPVMMPGYGSRAYPESYARPADPPPADQRPAGPRPPRPQPTNGPRQNGNQHRPGTYPPSPGERPTSPQPALPQPALPRPADGPRQNGNQHRPATYPQPAGPPANGHRQNGNHHQPPNYPPPPGPRPADQWPADQWPADGPRQNGNPYQPGTYPQPAGQWSTGQWPADGPRQNGNQHRPGTYPQPAGQWATGPQQAGPPPAPHPSAGGPRQNGNPYQPGTYPQPAAPPANGHRQNGNHHQPPNYPPPPGPRPADQWPADQWPADGPRQNGNPYQPGTYPQPAGQWPTGQPAPRPPAEEVTSEGQEPYRAAYRSNRAR